MISLFLDTASTKIIVALYKDNTLITKIEEDNDNRLSERLLPTISKIIEENNLTLKQINEIIVVNGPGSFTGIRIGVTVAKTMGYSLKITVKTISELAVLATTKVSTPYVCPYIDARRESIYTGLYDQFATALIEDQYIRVSDWKEQLATKTSNQNVTFVGYGLDETIKPEINYEVLPILFNRLPKQNPHQVNPNYLKKTEAEEKLHGSD